MNNNEKSVSVSRGLFRGLDSDGVSGILELGVSRKYRAGEIICLQGDEYNRLMLINRGCAFSEISDPAGKKIRLENFFPPAAIAPGILFAADNSMPVTVFAESDSEIIYIARNNVLELFRTNPVFLANFLTAMGNKINILADKIRLLKFSSLQQKIAGFILGLYEKQGQPEVILPYSREELADFFGVARPSLSRELSVMAESGILDIRGRNIRILKLTALRYLLEGSAVI